MCLLLLEPRETSSGSVTSRALASLDLGTKYLPHIHQVRYLRTPVISREAGHSRDGEGPKVALFHASSVVDLKSRLLKPMVSFSISGYTLTSHLRIITE